LRVEDFFPRKLLDVRVHSPHAVVEAAKAKSRREKLTRDGKLTILTCDHPARMTSIAEEPSCDCYPRISSRWS
jgi:hypothetical protein